LLVPPTAMVEAKLAADETLSVLFRVAAEDTYSVSLNFGCD
jgi:hypothetical protein